MYWSQQRKDNEAWQHELRRELNTPRLSQAIEILKNNPPPEYDPKEYARITEINTVSDLMRYIDAYAFDYQTEGKLSRSRRAVECALFAALEENL